MIDTTNPNQSPTTPTDPFNLTLNPLDNTISHLKDVTHEQKLPDSFINQRKLNQPSSGIYAYPEPIQKIQLILRNISELSPITSMEHLFSGDQFGLILNREEEDIIIRTMHKYGPELILPAKSPNFNRIIKFIISSCPIRGGHKFKPQITNSVFNALFFVQKITKLLLNSLYFDQVIDHFEGLNNENFSLDQISNPNNSKNIDPSSSLSPKFEQIKLSNHKTDKSQCFVFIDWLIEVIIYFDLRSMESMNFYHQALVTLLTLVSHDSYSPDESNLLNYIIRNHGRNAHNIVNRCLLLYFLPKSPEGYSLTGIFSYAYDYMFTGSSSKTTSKEHHRDIDINLNAPHNPNTLSYLAIHLITLLCFTNTSDEHNPFSEIIENYFEPIENQKTSKQLNFPRLNLSQVYYILVPNLNIEETSILFYIFSTKNPQFLNYCCSVTEPDKLIIPLIKMIYEAATHNQKLAHAHILLPPLLQFCNDSMFIDTLQKTIIPKQPWFQERLFRSIPLSELIMFVLIKIFNINLIEIKNQFIHTMCLTCIESLGKYLQNIQPLLVQKMLSLVDMGCKNLVKYGQSNRDRDDKLEGIKIFEEIIYILLSTINSIMIRDLPNNSQLVYGLLQQNDRLLQLQSHPSISPIIENLITVVSYFQSKLSEINSNLMTAEELMEEVQKISKSYKPHKLKKLPILTFEYVECEEQYEFWKSYIWILVELRVPILISDQLIKSDIEMWWS